MGQKVEASGGGLHVCWAAARLLRRAPSMCPSCEIGLITASVHLCRVAAYGLDGLRGLEGKYARLVAALSDAQWPTQRWPVHVFTAGAMTCLLTSSFCHLFGCCDWHWTKVRLPSCCRHGHQARLP